MGIEATVTVTRIPESAPVPEKAARPVAALGERG